ncbi:ribosomal protein S18 acetylase RimI-like enzyme [Diaminobutyricimonas aerilata]|uniref:Ribosomal protein S18 acetylase RimI-like enzyme n=1 Tax=Diaminobutyricimonas aerilata TaxID=1162967 RepID=A0A2M9CL50_9MICO|nr:ribosomal protein S18 acetylase RimI-like enzyme [Diaminobutyricimonas aerilata]
MRAARITDALPMARVHVESWRETYRGLMTDELLDDPEFVDHRERFWRGALTDARYAANRVAVAVHDDAIVGIAMAGPSTEPDAAAGWHLHVLYVLASHHGIGVGEGLLDAVLDAGQESSLWVADPNPRAQAFYRRHGFVAEGASRAGSGVREIRMLRSPT